MTQSATVELSNGAPFISDAELSSKLAKTDLSPATQEAVVSENVKARLAGLRASLWVLAVFSIVALFFTGLAPKRSLTALAAENSSGAQPLAMDLSAQVTVRTSCSWQHSARSYGR